MNALTLDVLTMERQFYSSGMRLKTLGAGAKPDSLDSILVNCERPKSFQRNNFIARGLSKLVGFAQGGHLIPKSEKKVGHGNIKTRSEVRAS